jgi:predicted Fe-S protein YdhL (DUF1289 family)
MQLEFFDVPSPCVGICQTDEKGLCVGCYRSRDERQTWINLNSDDKQKVIKRCQQRKKRKDARPKIKVIEEVAAANPQASLLDPPEKNKIENSQDMDFGEFEL